MRAGGSVFDKDFLDVLIAEFHAAHLRTFGYDYSGEQKVELVNFRVSGFGMIERPQIPELPARAESIPARKSTRPVYFDGAFQDAPVYDRASLGPRVRLKGPAVIEEFGSTTVLFPRQELAVDPHGVLVICRAQASAAGKS